MSQINVPKSLITLFSLGIIGSSLGAETPPGKLNLGLTNSLQTNLYEGDDVRKNYINRTTLSASITSPTGWVTSFGLSFNKQLNHLRQAGFSDIQLGLSGLTIPLNKKWALSGSGGLTLPLSYASKNMQGLATRIGLAPTLSYKADEDLLKNLSITYTPTMVVSFYKRQVQSTGAINVPYVLGNTLGFNYAFIPKRLTLALNHTYQRQWSMGGQSSDSFNFAQNLGYQWNKKLYTALGHSMGGSALRVDGQSSNLQFFDAEASTVYATLRFNF